MKNLLFVVLIIFLPVVALAEDASAVFLKEINAAQSYVQLGEIIGTRAGEMGLDLTEYNKLTESGKATVLQELIGNRYSSISNFVMAFENIIISSETPSKSSGSGGSSVIVVPSVPIEPYNCYISGVISLPGGEFAPQGGFEVSLHIDGCIYDIGVIPEGSSSVEYSGEYQIRTSSNVILRFILLGDEEAKYQTCTNIEPLPLSEENNTLNVDVEIPYAQHKIGGVLRLAEDIEVLDDDLQLRAYISNFDTMFSIYKTLVAGQREVGFLVGVATAEYNIVYYADTYGISEFQHILEESEALVIDVTDGDQTDIVIPVIGQNYIEGYVRLPDGEPAPEGGLSVSVGRAIVEIPQGEFQAYYRTGMYYESCLICSVLTEDYSGTQFSGGYYTTEDVLSLKHYNAAYFDNLSENLIINLILRKMQWIEGVIALSEPLNCDGTLSISTFSDLYDYNNDLDIKAGTTSIPYFIEIEENAGSPCYINWQLIPNGPEYLELFGSEEFAVEEPFNQYNIDVQVVKAAVLFKGNISLPEGVSASEDIGVCLNFESENYSYSHDCVIDTGESSTEYAIYGREADIINYSGDYTLFAYIPYLTNAQLFYDVSGFSFESSFSIAVENETILQNLVLPAPNRVITGRIIMPVPAENELKIGIAVNTDYQDTYYKSITVPKGSEGLDYNIGLLIPSENYDYTIRYVIENSGNYPYYSGLEMYLSDNGFTLDYNERRTVDLYGELEPFEMNIDLSALYVNAYIKGEFILPDLCVIPDGRYFKCSLFATNGNRTESCFVRVDAGYNKACYIISVPEAYKGGEWVVYYALGNVVSEPNAPAVPPRPGASSGSGGSFPLPSGMVFPENLLIGYNIYIAQNGGLTFHEEQARKFTFGDGGFENIDIYALGTDTPAPRIIGGFFTSVVAIPDEGVNVSVILQNTATGEELAQSFIFTGDAVKYKFETYGEGEYILKYIIAGETFYYKYNYKLTADIGSATVIETAGIPAQYKKDVYYNNIYPDSYYAEHLVVRKIVTHVGIETNIKLLIYNTDGVLLNEAYKSTVVITGAVPVVLGYSIGGYKAYFTDYSSGSVWGTTTDFSEAARIYVIPKSSSIEQLYADVPVVGMANGIGT
ncbi:MAG: hypothetical protein GX800_03575, partial [Clostridiaceae bacterium]|nr:hypothetical protein [Clostridiaceae bacterium]